MDFPDIVSNATIPPPPPPLGTEINAVVNNEDQARSSEGNGRRRNLSHNHQSMYTACLVGDCVAAELLLERDPSLAREEISEEGDRALHVAASMKHHKLVRKLVKRMRERPTELALRDGHGYTACCYAAISGAIEIADLMMRENPSLATARDRENKTPLHKAALRGKVKMVSYLLKSTKAEDFSTQDWFDLLLLTIRRKMYGVAIKVLGINERLATMSNDEGTALHLLAGQRFYMTRKEYRNGVMQREMRSLAEKLWAGIQTSGAIELMKNPPILHNAAKVGNVEFITMLTHAYPELVWRTNTEGYTIFHIAVKYGQVSVFELINEIGARKDLIALSQDNNGNNILHLVGKLAELEGFPKWIPPLEMRKEMLWFERVKETIPPLCCEMKNNNGETAEELFLGNRKRLLEESRRWIRNESNSCLIVATLIFTVAFGSTFTVPGGYNQNTGIPLLVGTSNSKWLIHFATWEALAMVFSICSILCFLSIMMNSSMKDVHFARHIPKWFLWGVSTLSLSIIAATYALSSTYQLIYNGGTYWFANMVVMFIGTAVCYMMFARPIGIGLLQSNPSEKRCWDWTRHTLFKQPGGVFS